jgi:hypothetical protein
MQSFTKTCNSPIGINVTEDCVDRAKMLLSQTGLVALTVDFFQCSFGFFCCLLVQNKGFIGLLPLLLPVKYELQYRVPGALHLTFRYCPIEAIIFFI